MKVACQKETGFGSRSKISGRNAGGLPRPRLDDAATLDTGGLVDGRKRRNFSIWSGAVREGSQSAEPWIFLPAQFPQNHALRAQFPQFSRKSELRKWFVYNGRTCKSL